MSTTGPAEDPTELEVIKAKGSRLTCSYKEEERALNLGLDWINLRSDISAITFCTDSLSLLQAINSLNNSTINVRQKMENINSMIHLLYVPGHKDVPGNEMSDKHAKEAAKLTSPCLDQSVTIKEAKSVAKRQIKDPPSTHHTISKTYEGVSLQRDRTHVKTRKEATLLAQLRSGHHLSLGYYRHMLDESRSSICERCNTDAIDTVEHWLTECAATLAQRQKLFGNVDQRLQDLALEPDKVLRLAERTLFREEESS